VGVVGAVEAVGAGVETGMEANGSGVPEAVDVFMVGGGVGARIVAGLVTSLGGAKPGAGVMGRGTGGRGASLRPSVPLAKPGLGVRGLGARSLRLELITANYAGGQLSTWPCRLF
jgi:hypothetical protein